MSFIVAIDGTAGSGKGTISNIIAKELNLTNIDTGATYRCVALATIKNNIKLEEKKNSLEEVSEVLDTEEDFVRNKEDDILIPVEIEEKKEKLEVPQDNPLHKLAEEIKKDILTEDIPLVEVTKQEAKKEIKKETTSVKQEKDNNTSSTNMSSIFSSLASSEETFSTYYVYMVRETDTIESIIDKYQTTKEELQNYNDLTNVKVGSKLIIPCASNE